MEPKQAHGELVCAWKSAAKDEEIKNSIIKRLFFFFLKPLEEFLVKISFLHCPGRGESGGGWPM